MQDVVENNSAIIWCPSKKKATWKLNKRILKFRRNIKRSSQKILIKIIKDKHQGTYECHGTDWKGIKFVATSILIVLSKSKYYLHHDNNIYNNYCMSQTVIW